MKRTAFTMIELIFVIVILGILASVALPRLGGVQDDALVASEQAAIASARTGVQSLRGRRLVRGQAVINVNVTNSQGIQGTLIYSAVPQTDPAIDPAAFTPAGFPWSLSTSDAQTVPPANLSRAATGTQSPMIAVLDVPNPGAWNIIVDVTDGNFTRIQGPASTTIQPGSTAALTTDSNWRYDAFTGQILLDVNGTAL